MDLCGIFHHLSIFIDQDHFHFVPAICPNTVEFTTDDPDSVIDAFMAACHHGMSVFECYGAYSQKKHYVCKAVISTYELRDVIENVQKVDPKVLINTYNTVNFYGNFYQKPLE